MSDIIRIDVVQLKRGYKDNLIRVLQGALKPKDGEPIFEIDTGKLKFGDGIHDYIDLEYFKTGDVEVANALDGQILVYNATEDKWEPKNFVDGVTIEYGQSGLQIAGYTGEIDQQGAAPVSNNGGITWQQLLTDTQLETKLAEADELVRQAGQYKAQAIAAAQDASMARQQTEQIRDLFMDTLNKKFWYGTQAQYMEEVIAQDNLTEGTIYFIYDFDYDTFPEENLIDTDN